MTNKPKAMNNTEYNYKHFNPKDYNFNTFEGPKAGEMIEFFMGLPQLMRQHKEVKSVIYNTLS